MSGFSASSGIESQACLVTSDISGGEKREKCCGDAIGTLQGYRAAPGSAN
jgi:hypothetical protein